MKISIVIPVYNGEKTIGMLADELVRKLKHYVLEIVLVNDGSPDNSHRECLALFNKYKDLVKDICLSRNFGEHNAVLTGYRHAHGAYVVNLDDDGQNPPAEAVRLWEHARGHDLDVVFGHYARKEHSAWRNLGSSSRSAPSALAALAFTTVCTRRAAAVGKRAGLGERSGASGKFTLTAGVTVNGRAFSPSRRSL